MSSRRKSYWMVPALIGVLAGGLTIGGCSDVRQAVGVERMPPDEFRVQVRAPLVMPADFGLRAPAADTEATGTDRRLEQARQVVLETRGIDAERAAPHRIEGVEGPESVLLAKLGADRVDPDIRTRIARESRQIDESRDSFVNSILFWKDPPQPGTLVDARKERQRLQENAALGRSPAEGETPIIERKKRGSLF